MIKALSLAAALAVLPLSAALAGEPQSSPQAAPSSTDAAEAAIEAAAERFEARMEAYGERAEAIKDDANLTEAQKKLQIAAVWAEYQPDVAAFTAVVSDNVGSLLGGALADIDVEALVADAMDAVEESGVMQMAGGMATNGAWASNDPEHMATYGLVAQYAVGEALDAIDEASGGEISVHLGDDEAAEAPASAPTRNGAD
jgi:enamine deaminase RidA (YjgF/YER057c/UK114 family)